MIQIIPLKFLKSISMKKGKPIKLATANKPFTPLTKKIETDENPFMPLYFNDLVTPKKNDT